MGAAVSPRGHHRRSRLRQVGRAVVGRQGLDSARRERRLMLALPAASAPERRHSLLVGTSFAVAAGAAAFAGLLGTYLVARERELDALREAGKTCVLRTGVMPELPSKSCCSLLERSIMVRGRLACVGASAAMLLWPSSRVPVRLGVLTSRSRCTASWTWLTSSPSPVVYGGRCVQIALLVGWCRRRHSVPSLGGRYAATDTTAPARRSRSLALLTWRSSPSARQVRPQVGDDVHQRFQAIGFAASAAVVLGVLGGPRDGRCRPR